MVHKKEHFELILKMVSFSLQFSPFPHKHFCEWSWVSVWKREHRKKWECNLEFFLTKKNKTKKPSTKFFCKVVCFFFIVKIFFPSPSILRHWRQSYGHNTRHSLFSLPVMGDMKHGSKLTLVGVCWSTSSPVKYDVTFHTFFCLCVSTPLPSHHYHQARLPLLAP